MIPLPPIIEIRNNVETGFVERDIGIQRRVSLGSAMVDEMKRYVCIPSGQGLRTLTFKDGSRVSVLGLTEILEAVYLEDRGVNSETAGEILKRLEATNYVPWSARQEYCDAIIHEYAKYVESHPREP